MTGIARLDTARRRGRRHILHFCVLGAMLAAAITSCTDSDAGNAQSSGAGFPSGLDWIRPSSTVESPLSIPDQLSTFIRVTFGDPSELPCVGTLSITAGAGSADVSLIGSYFQANVPEYPSRHVFILGDGADLILVADFAGLDEVGRVEIGRRTGFLLGGSSLKSLDSAAVADGDSYKISGTVEGTGEYAGASGAMDVDVTCGDSSDGLGTAA